MSGKPFDYVLAWQRDNNENDRKSRPVLCERCRGEVHHSDFFKPWQPRAVSRWSKGTKICEACHMKQLKEKKKGKEISFEEIVKEIASSLAKEDGERVASIYGEVCGRTIKYEGDSIWSCENEEKGKANV